MNDEGKIYDNNYHNKNGAFSDRNSIITDYTIKAKF